MGWGGRPRVADAMTAHVGRRRPSISCGPGQGPAGLSFRPPSTPSPDPVPPFLVGSLPPPFPQSLRRSLAHRAGGPEPAAGVARSRLQRRDRAAGGPAQLSGPGRGAIKSGLRAFFESGSRCVARPVRRVGRSGIGAVPHLHRILLDRSFGRLSTRHARSSRKCACSSSKTILLYTESKVVRLAVKIELYGLEKKTDNSE